LFYKNKGVSSKNKVNTMKTIFQKVEKEMVSEISFKKDIDIDQHSDLISQLYKAMILGNEYHTKVSICFIDDIGPKQIETTIWYAGTKFICLKGGRFIPIDHIVEVKF
jgi:hypothetical protein